MRPGRDIDNSQAGRASAGSSPLARILLAAAACALSLGIGVSAVAAPADADRVAAIFPPWWSAERALIAAASAGQIAGGGQMDNVVIVVGQSDGLSRRLREAGSVILLSPGAVRLCGEPTGA